MSLPLLRSTICSFVVYQHTQCRDPIKGSDHLFPLPSTEQSGAPVEPRTHHDARVSGSTV